ncbi:hypothetical protein IMSAGC014_02120 [Bacteroidaceae bacterium]|uniref:hypothetical protein n=1 Tax=Bacteroides acidifaciens TaxID=85831 RepID=UPI001434320D|nr:hypothetical protein [Bacteroides acidifaciens]GFI35599.1 hypothetical protein IMSAGC014_02120 [Bacteroidaceae bacterium]
MSEIDCVNLLAFIQFIVAFDFGLYYFDDKHTLAKIYRKYQSDLRSSTQAILTLADDKIKATLNSDNEECMLKGAYLDKTYRRLKYLTDEGRLLEGCGFIGLYAGLYGFLCLFCIGIFKSQYDAPAKAYILVISQIILAVELLIAIYNFIQEDCSKYSRNIWSNIRLIICIILFAAGLLYFDCTYKFFSEFELPFTVISLLVLLFPFILFVGHIVVTRIVVNILKLRCRYYISQIDTLLTAENKPHT